MYLLKRGKKLFYVHVCEKMFDMWIYDDMKGFCCVYAFFASHTL